jgi:hypothetical protein
LFSPNRNPPDFFHKDRNMSDAIQIKHPDRLFIGGKWIRPSGAKQLRLVNPADEEIFFEVAEAEQGDVEAAVAAARTAFDHGPWPNAQPFCAKWGKRWTSAPARSTTPG